MTRIKFIICVVLSALLILLSCQPTNAQVTLPKIFGDHMILQRNMNVPIYGWAAVGEKIKVDFMGKSFYAITGANGKWLVKLGRYSAGGPYEMHIQGRSTQLNYKDILLGDVWLASGQSNMEYGLQTEKHGAETISKANDSLIHVFYVPVTLSLRPTDKLPPNVVGSPNGRWVVCSPEAMANPELGWHGITAVGYYFAQQIRKATGVPVGLIGSYRGATPAQAWISEDGLKQEPACEKYANAHQKLIDIYGPGKATYSKKLALYQDSLKQWEADSAKARSAGLPLKPRPLISKRAPTTPLDPLDCINSPTVCYNGMIAPLVGYGIKGVIWYQGEGNGNTFADATGYQQLFTSMIRDWRHQWRQGNFAFLFVQLPNWRAPAKTPSEGYWPLLREGQQLTSKALANTGMAVITDAGDAVNIHPTNKLIPGNRLALVALHKIYGEKIVSSGPVYQSMKIKGNKIIVKFKEVNRGLMSAMLIGDSVINTNSRELNGFGISGEDHKFVWAKANIKGNTVVVSSDAIANPKAVRYNWADNPPGNLYNKNGLPANPFRSDNWPE
jgi:sialate O-acetylesterase